MSSLALTTGKTFASGEKVTPAKLNQAVNSATYTGELPVVNGGTGAATAAAARTNLGLGGMATNTLAVAAAGVTANVNQTGSAPGAELIFNTVNAPIATLTAGKWLVIGTVTARMSDTPGEVKLEFSDNAGTDTFGCGASKVLPTTRDAVTVIGYVEVASGTKYYYFKGTPAAGSTLNFGSADATAFPGSILAFKLEG